MPGIFERIENQIIRERTKAMSCECKTECCKSCCKCGCHKPLLLSPLKDGQVVFRRFASRDAVLCIVKEGPNVHNEYIVRDSNGDRYTPHRRDLRPVKISPVSTQGDGFLLGRPPITAEDITQEGGIFKNMW